jgi:hypothetical protein
MINQGDMLSLSSSAAEQMSDMHQSMKVINQHNHGELVMKVSLS